MARTAGKKPLSQARILSAAVQYAHRNGLAGLNMRNLAQQLDAGPMSLYHYFASKDALLDAMVEWVAEQIEIPESGIHWRDAMAKIAGSAYRTLTRHAWVNEIWSKRTLGPFRLAYMEAILRILREGGFSVSLACDAYHAVTAHVQGFTLQALDFPIESKDIQSAATNFLVNAENREAIPYFIEHVQHHIDHAGEGNQFEMMLNFMLDGFERVLIKDP